MQLCDWHGISKRKKLSFLVALTPTGEKKCYLKVALNIQRLLSVSSACVMAAMAVAACGDNSSAPPGGAAGSLGNPAFPNAGAGVQPGPTAGSAAIAGTGSGVGGANGTPTAGSGSNPQAGASNGGANQSGGGASNGGSAQVACTDKQLPDKAGQPCSIWPEWDLTKGANEAKDCDASWLTGAGYCLESCGKCSNGGGKGGSGSGGSGGGYSTGLGPGPTLPDVSSGQVMWASRYWDCCKPHCAQQGMPSCGEDGKSNNNGTSACSGGGAYACYNEAPRAVGDNVSYGYVAVPNPSCGTCYNIQFTGTGQHNANDPGSKTLAGKHMIVKVTNTGGDVAGNQFDLMIPGGGVGINPNTCPKQWKVSSGDLGPAQGGFLTSCNSGTHQQKKDCVRQKCMLLPDGDVRKGCLWFVDWYQVADNPNFRYAPIACPNDM